MRVANKLRGMISLAQKAGKIVSGETAVRAAIQKGQAVMLLAEEGASANTKDTMNKLATAYAVPMRWSDAQKAQLFIGYLASFPKQEKQDESNAE